MKTGRPSFKPTPRQRERVAMHAACGTPQDVIAGEVGISPVTLRKHFAQELSRGKYLVDAEIGGVLANMARGKDRNGKPVPPNVQLDACKFWLSRRAKWTEEEPQPVPEFDYAQLTPEKRKLLCELLEEAKIRTRVPTTETSTPESPGEATPTPSA